MEIARLSSSFAYDAIKNILSYFLSFPGKYLRPALVLLSARSVSDAFTDETRERLVNAALAVELIHNASLVHDDIIDEGKERRGQPTLNAKWGNRIAVLAGDSLYSHAFGILTRVLPPEYLDRIVRLIETMCAAEIEQERAGKSGITKAAYLLIIEGKTAGFMKLCCRLGAYIAGGDGNAIAALEEFGLAFGMAYQVFDDYADGDLPCAEIDGIRDGSAYVDAAVASVGKLPRRAGCDKLADLARFLLVKK